MAASRRALARAGWRVDNVRSRDEIGDLATRFNDMIVQINKRFELDTRKDLVLNVELCFTGCMDVRS